MKSYPLKKWVFPNKYNFEQFNRFIVDMKIRLDTFLRVCQTMITENAKHVNFSVSYILNIPLHMYREPSRFPK